MVVGNVEIKDQEERQKIWDKVDKLTAKAAMVSEQQRRIEKQNKKREEEEKNNKEHEEVLKQLDEL